MGIGLLRVQYRLWAARLILGSLLTCTGCSAARELTQAKKPEPAHSFLPSSVGSQPVSTPAVPKVPEPADKHLPSIVRSQKVPSPAGTKQLEPADEFLPPVVRSQESLEGEGAKQSAQPQPVATTGWKTQPKPGEGPTSIAQVTAERVETEVASYEPASMSPLRLLDTAESGKLSAPSQEIPSVQPKLDPPEPGQGLPALEAEKPNPADQKGQPKDEATEPETGKTPPATDQAPGPAPLEFELASGELLTLEDAERLAVSSNPALLQAGEAIEKARGYHLQLGLRPNPQVGYMASEVFNEGHAGQQGVYFNQTFVRGDKQELDQEVLCREISRLEWEFRVQEARVLTDVRQQYYQVLGNQRRVELLKKLESNVKAAAEGLKKLVDAGEIPEVDFLQINLLASELRLKRENAEIELAAGRKQLAALMSKPDLLIGEVAGTLDQESGALDMEVLFGQLLANSPQIQAATSRVARAQAMIMRQERQIVPNLQAQTALLQDTSTNHTIFNLQLGVDLPYRNRNQGNIAAAVADYRKAVEQRRQLELALRSQFSQTMGQIQQAENSVRIYEETIVPQSGQNLAKVRTAYDAGELDLTRLFVAQQGNVEASLQLIAAQVNYRQLQALLDGALLSGGLLNEVDTEVDSSLRGSSLDGQ